MKKLSLLVLFLVAASATQLSAQSLSNCGTAPLSTYDSGDFECRLNGGNGGILLFGGFAFVPGTSSYTDSQIEVTPEPQGEGGGFSFSLVPPQGQAAPEFSTPAGTGIQFGIDYSYVITVDPFVDAASLGLDPVTGDVLVTENVCVDPFPVESTNLSGAHGCTSTHTFSVDDTNPPTSLLNTIPIDPAAVNGADVTILFQLGGANSPSSTFDALSSTNEVVDTIAPEPVSSILGLGGLLAVVVKRRWLNA